LQLKLAPKLTTELLKPSHFNKMRVPAATSVLSRDVSGALKHMVAKEGRPEENLTTAWLIEGLVIWFELMTSRHPVLALSKLSPQR
jgi:hypothetical protein